MAEGRTRIVLGGRMHGRRVAVPHGSTMVDAATGNKYRRHGLSWWVPQDDTDEQAMERIKAYERQ